ncbi:T9SS type B sorting domain-containing protein [Flavobacterium sp. Sd200]|uniref:T9SS type B sorting domain-containing protein n=1 Tax=Flavobacterium sp. Sd200 TaxID=2692211 RepID=UPI001370D476|nr:T9SS type B sorting domain-containing protein [Flavobacterium sp. Sd200]MXN91781.1 T9SS type B sorting domain-containing protein [Flavobacterium sp. Sd200]
MYRFKYVLFCILLSVTVFGQEICNNGIDDDGDGKIDLNDEDCACGSNSVTSLLNNHDFEQMNFCPNDFALFNAATGWFLPNDASTDYINSCGFVPLSATDAGIYPLPPLNGNGVAGILVSQDYKEFIAACTTATLRAGTTYQLNFDIASSTSGRILSTDPNRGQVCNNGNLNAGRIDITLYGKRVCDRAFEDTYDLPSGWRSLGTVTYLPSKNWTQLSVIFTPLEDLNSIMLGPPDVLPDSYVKEYDYSSCFPYFYFDNVVLNSVSDLGVKINSTGSFCDNTLTLTAETVSGSGNIYQWYRDGIAIAGATDAALHVDFNDSNLANYQVKVDNAGSCKISPFYNIDKVLDFPEYSIDQSPCFPGRTTVTITTVADEYSFDNGVTWSSNPSQGNYTAADRILLIIKKNGCISGARRVVLTFPPIVGFELNVIQPGCNTNGSITVTTPALEYSFDNGITWTTNNTLSDLPPNYNFEYKVKIKSLIGCILGFTTVVMRPFFFPEPDVTSTGAGCGNEGTITILTPGMQYYSIDGGITWSSNPIFTNLEERVYNVMVKNDLGCISLSKAVYIVRDYLPMPEVVVVQPDCGVSGYVTVVTPALEYSYDNGVTWTTDNTVNLSPEYYYIVIKNSEGCTSRPNVIVIRDYVLDVTINHIDVNPSCSNNGSINITTQALEYSIDDGRTWQSNPLFNNLREGYYALKVRNGIDCESYSMVVELVNFNNITPNYEIKNAGCDTYGSLTIDIPADLYSFDDGLTWSENNSIYNLSGDYVFNILAKKHNNCITQTATVYFNSDYIQPPIVNDYTAYLCDVENNGKEIINLQSYNQHLIANFANYTFYYFSSITEAQNFSLLNQISNYNNYEVANSTVIYVAVLSPNNCFSIATVSFIFLQSPDITPVFETIILCENTNVTLSAGNGFSSYLWSNGDRTNTTVVDKPGNYTVTVTKDYGNIICSAEKKINVVLSNAATILDVLIEDFAEPNNIIEIKTEGLGDYVYSLDGINYQKSNLFTNLSSGVYKVYVRDKNDCGITTKDVFLLTYPKYFTPNGDGVNDVWAIKFSHLYSTFKVSIFDRYGKLIKQLNNKEYWDGTFNGHELPSGDYWFLVTRNNGDDFKGHFSLLR